MGQNFSLNQSLKVIQFFIKEGKMHEELTKESVERLIILCKLQSKEAEIMSKYINHARIEKKVIRDCLSQEGRITKQAFYLIEGQVNINVSLSNGQKVVLSQIGKDQVVNLEIILSNWINTFSINVSTSFIKYITFEERQIKLLAQNIIPELQQKTILREKQINKRNKQIKDMAKRKKFEDNINKLILPEISLPGNKKTIIHINLNHKQQISSLNDLPLFFNQLKKQGRSSSLGQMKSRLSRYSQPVGIFQKEIELINKNIINKFHENQNKQLQMKPTRLKSEKTISLNQKQEKQIDYSRNQRLFKEHLKNIVKRKLLFERKHFKILTDFKNDTKEIVQQCDNKKSNQEIPQNPIDNYFIM